LGVFYHLDHTGKSLRSGQLLALMPLSANLPPEDAAMSARWCPGGVTRFGHDIFGRKLEPAVLAREIEVERVRREFFPQCVTRYAVVFGCKELVEIEDVRWQFFLPSHTGQRGRIWKIEGAAVFRADMNVFKDYCGDDTAAAHAYWSRKETVRPLIEYLLKPPVRVLGEVSGG
jgi:hypothetical protein